MFTPSLTHTRLLSVLFLMGCASQPDAAVRPAPRQRVKVAKKTIERAPLAGCARGEYTPEQGVRLRCGMFEVVVGAQENTDAQSVLASVDRVLFETHRAQYSGAKGTMSIDHKVYPSLEYAIKTPKGRNKHVLYGRYVVVVVHTKRSSASIASSAASSRVTSNRVTSNVVHCVTRPEWKEQCDTALEEIVRGGIPAPLGPAAQMPQENTSVVPRILGQHITLAHGCVFERQGRVRCGNAVLTWRKVDDDAHGAFMPTFVRNLSDQLERQVGAVKRRTKPCKLLSKQRTRCDVLRAHARHQKTQTTFWVGVARGTGKQEVLISCGYSTRRNHKKMPKLCKNILF